MHTNTQIQPYIMLRGTKGEIPWQCSTQSHPRGCPSMWQKSGFFVRKVLSWSYLIIALWSAVLFKLSVTPSSRGPLTRLTPHAGIDSGSALMYHFQCLWAGPRGCAVTSCTITAPFKLSIGNIDQVLQWREKFNSINWKVNWLDFLCRYSCIKKNWMYYIVMIHLVVTLVSGRKSYLISES